MACWLVVELVFVQQVLPPLLTALDNAGLCRYDLALPSAEPRCPLVPLSPDTLQLLEKFEVDPVRGFLPSEDPLLRLPQPELQPWEDLVSDLPALLSAAQARLPLSRLPILPITLLETEPQRRRALLLLSMLCHAFVWGEPARPADALPPGIAVPLWRLAADMGVPPVMTHLSLVLYNWRRLDPRGALDATNLAAACQFLGGHDEAWFYLTTVEIEARGGPAMAALLQAQRAATAASAASSSAAAAAAACAELAACLRAVEGAVHGMRGALRRMSDGCDPRAFYHRVRPFLSGWRANPTLPRGVQYTGVPASSAAAVAGADDSSSGSCGCSGDGSICDGGGGGSGGGGCGCSARACFYGGSAAQSSLFAALDAALGIAHDGAGAGAAFLANMRAYMPPSHRAFLAHLGAAAAPGVRGCVAALRGGADGGGSSAQAAVDAYDAAVAAVEAFRTAHIGIVTAYILQQARGGGSGAASPAPPEATKSSGGGGGVHADASPEREGMYTRDKASGGKGTGGTDLLEFLRPLRDDARAAVLQRKR
ncbi:indole 2,3-dioxygenase [Tribonema minus]|uniref:Indole 2,3-dioxygenase n=1 Tax=Tribonema minus TaxID=303371 RepID=A0A836CBY0_9STRA|nr:indole 2,3-dioxygenase [Tribonema minus]